jgi:hypothetical protein
MPGALVHVGAMGMCPHLGQISVISTNTRVFVGNMPVATALDTFPIVGCVFQIPATPPIPHPCVQVKWLVPATRVFVNFLPVVLQVSGGLCLAVDMLPQGPPAMTTVQPRVTGI